MIETDTGIRLPLAGTSESELVAFTDILGSGQQHLIRVGYNGVTCFPNLGHGRFGQPIPIPGFARNEASFHPDRIYMADIDGSGTTDIIYAEADKLIIYPNQSGNSFATPFEIALPEGVRYDQTCRLTVADLQGLGMSSILLSIPHQKPRHFRFDPMPVKAYLLNEVNNNMGTSYQLKYRSSAQCWLDEKLEWQTQGRPAMCKLPFPIHVVSETLTLDEITGNSLSQAATYYHGYYDGKKRELRVLDV